MDLQVFYLNVYATIYFNFKLQLKLRNNKNYSTVVVNFHTGLSYKCINLKFKIRKNKVTRRREPLTGTVNCHFSEA
jgi:hypothetical protein